MIPVPAGAGSVATTVPFNILGIYRFCIAFALIDYFDVLDYLDLSQLNNPAKYLYAFVALAFIASYFVRWKKFELSIAPAIFFIFFIITGAAFAINFFVNDTRQSYVTAFIGSLVYALAMFIPAGAVGLDARRLTGDLLLVFSIGTVCYLIEAAIKPLDAVSTLTYLHEVQVHKSMVCVLAICLSILMGRKKLAIFLLIVTVAALLLRPMSTLLLTLVGCVPVAMMLRFRVRAVRLLPVMSSAAVSFVVLIVAASVPLLLYFFFDDVSAIIDAGETYLKTDVIGGQSNMAFRLQILKIAFAPITDAFTFIFGNGLLGNHTVPLGQLAIWQWWYTINSEGEAPIHSDFVIVFIQMGIVGYFFFALAFYSALLVRFRQLMRVRLSEYGVVLQSISIIGILILIIYVSDEPVLSYYNHTQAIWLLLLISEVARKSINVNLRGRNKAPKLGLIASRR